MDRYSRQAMLPQIGLEGQKKIQNARIAIVGLGALGSVLSQLCARAGIGVIRLIDRDVVELTNLQRQVLFTEYHAKSGLAKATASKEELQKINSTIQIESVVDDLRPDNIAQLLNNVDVILDGTDNFETRYLLNDFAVKNKVPFIYGGAIATEGMSYSVFPDGRPCLRCLFPQAPDSPETQTCDLNGVLASISHWTASLQFTQLICFLVKGASSVSADLTQYDIWRNETRRISAHTLGASQCDGCREGKFLSLDFQSGSQTLKLCGRNAVQVQPQFNQKLNWESLHQRWNSQGGAKVGEDFARLVVDDYELTLFKNGRALVKGTEDPAKARSLYAKWVGC